MLDALLRDLPGVSLGVLVDYRLPLAEAFLSAAKVRVFTVDRSNLLETAFRQALAWADAVWPIAPETGGLLASLSRQVVLSGKKLLGSDVDAVALTADKYRTLEHLRRAGIDTVPCCHGLEFDFQFPPPWIVKPVDGVGCEGTFRTCRQPDRHDKLLVQPFIDGESLSLSALFDCGKTVLLSVNRQLVEVLENRLVLSGCEVNALSDDDGSLQNLCRRIAAAIPGLWGYAGVDLIRSEDGRLWVLEINPRLTLSYAGLSRALGRSVAEMVVAMAAGDTELERIAAWREGWKGRRVWVSAK